MRRPVPLLLASLLLLPARLPAGETVAYDADIQPLFDASCGGAFCHIGQAISGVDLSTYETTLASVGNSYGALVVKPFDSAGSALWTKVAMEFPEFGLRMPYGEDPLPPEAIDVIALWIDQGAGRGETPAPLRGDMDRSGDLTITDPIQLLQHLFLGGPPPPCDAVANSNSDQQTDVSDAIYILDHLFLGGPPLAALTPGEIEACS